MVVPIVPLLHAAARIALTEFTVHWSTLIGVCEFMVLYQYALRKKKKAGDAGPTRVQFACFTSALVLMFFSLNGWLHDLSDYYLFSAHMVQHLMLTLVVPPLLILGTPGWMFRLMTPKWLMPFAKWVTGAPRTFLIFTAVLSVWHLPPVYETAMNHHGLHIVQHLCFMVAATLMWWPILSPMPELPRLSYPLQMLYLFLMTIPMSLVAICIGYADSVLYPFYASAPRLWGISPMEDQLMGALIMWVPGGLFFFAVITVIFFRWQAAGSEDHAAGAQVDWQPAR